MEEIDSAWEIVKKEFRNPALDKPVYSSETNTADINLASKEIRVSPEFVENLDIGSDGLLGLLEHEVGHYFYHPFDSDCLVMEVNYLKDRVKDAKKLSYIINLYDDVKTNTLLMLNNRDRYLTKTLKADLEHSRKKLGNVTDIRKIIHSFYSRISGRDCGASEECLDSVLREHYDELFVIDFSEKNRKLNNEWLGYFYRIIGDLIDEDNMEGSQSVLSPYSDSQLKEVIDRLIRQGKIKRNDMSGLGEALNGIGVGVDLGSSAVENDIYYYFQKAFRYPIKIKGIPLVTSDSSFPCTHKTFSASDPFRSLDMLNSFGRVLPGISKKWEDKSVTHHGNRTEVPDCILMLDTSGSMNANESVREISCLGAFAAYHCYRLNNAEIAVINFSDKSILFDFESGKTLKGLATNQKGGTTLDLGVVKKASSSREGLKDYLMITDVQISNIGDVIDFLGNEHERGSRCFIFCIDNESFSEDIRGVKVFHVNDESDLPKIVLEKII